MLWLVILSPLLIIGVIAVYFEKKSGMQPPDGSKQKDNLVQVLNQNDKNTRF
ncbi:hypothetical protein [Oceanobacillus piezotolerans]|uniref:hypothetical protein n=1 Tax=Oceanobacillus piezotolerans TaxID=2448030 RepID=UPI001314E1F5|nr:hypothetical protein [Oceanobacillus piezotolerans]